MNGCYCSAVLHMASGFAYLALHDLSYNPPSAKTVHPGLIYRPEAFTMFIAWASMMPAKLCICDLQ